MANEKEYEGKSGIRVVDRRRFDSDGEEKTEESAASSEVKSQPVAATAPQSTKPVASEEKIDSQDNYNPETNQNFTMTDSIDNENIESEQSDISFGSFVLSLATQALMQLGQLQAPDGMSIPVDPIAAKQTIDILGMLQTKTKGNLDPKEEGLLRDALQSLKMAYLRA